MTSQKKCFSTALSSSPGIYIPVLFISEGKLITLLKTLDLLTPYQIDIHPKTLSNGTQCNYAFIIPFVWHSNENANKMRSKLLANEEVKIVIDERSFIICKRKHEEGIAFSPIPNARPTYIDFNHIAPAPRHVKGVSRTPSPESNNDYCRECEEGMENQLAHSCIQRLIAQESWEETF